MGLEQSAYKEGISINDGPLINNELFPWANKKVKRKVLVVKVDFDKMFDSLNWGFLDSITEQIKLNNKWRN